MNDGMKRINVLMREWRRKEKKRMDKRMLEIIWKVYK